MRYTRRTSARFRSICSVRLRATVQPAGRNCRKVCEDDLRGKLHSDQLAWLKLTELIPASFGGIRHAEPVRQSYNIYGSFILIGGDGASW